MTRCWETTDPLYLAYHDEEWGRPVTSETGIYERLCLEGFQSGLSWLTIVRHRGKIEAAIANARATLALRETEASLVRLFWSQTSGEALSKELRRAGFRFVGPTTAYAAMQACGVVNDHVAECFVRAEVQREIDAAF